MKSSWKFVLIAVLTAFVATFVYYWFGPYPNDQQVAKWVSEVKPEATRVQCDAWLTARKIPYTFTPINVSGHPTDENDVDSDCYDWFHAQKAYNWSTVGGLIIGHIDDTGVSFPCGTWRQTIYFYLNRDGKLITSHISGSGSCL